MRPILLAAASLLTLGVVTLGFGASHAQAPATAPAAAAAKPKRTLQYLTPQEVDPSRLLAAPPRDGSPINQAELADLHHIIDARTDARYAQAKWDDDHEDPSLFSPTLGPRFDLKSLPATAAVLAIVQNDADVAASNAKAYFQRKRPWAVDATIKTCDPNDKPLSSFPSGHSTLGYSLAMTLAYLMPEHAQLLLTRASDYAFSRAVCGSHYISDTQASQVLSAAMFTALLTKPEFQAKLDAARSELQGAGWR